MNMSTQQTKTITFGPVARFRTIDGDLAIIRHAAEARGQTLSAYLRDAAMSHALSDLNVATREQAMRKIKRKAIGADEL